MCCGLVRTSLFGAEARRSLGRNLKEGSGWGLEAGGRVGSPKGTMVTRFSPTALPTGGETARAEGSALASSWEGRRAVRAGGRSARLPGSGPTAASPSCQLRNPVLVPWLVSMTKRQARSIGGRWKGLFELPFEDMAHSVGEGKAAGEGSRAGFPWTKRRLGYRTHKLHFGSSHQLWVSLANPTGPCP